MWIWNLYPNLSRAKARVNEVNTYEPFYWTSSSMSSHRYLDETTWTQSLLGWWSTSQISFPRNSTFWKWALLTPRQPSFFFLVIICQFTRWTLRSWLSLQINCMLNQGYCRSVEAPIECAWCKWGLMQPLNSHGLLSLPDSIIFPSKLLGTFEPSLEANQNGY